MVERTRKNILQRRSTKNLQTIDKVINNMFLNKSPGKYLIIPFWLKKLHFYRDRLTEFYQNSYDGKETLPTWLTEPKTTRITKSQHTKNNKNYRPIACLNLTYKIYTSCLNIFLLIIANKIISLHRNILQVKKDYWAALNSY